MSILFLVGPGLAIFLFMIGIPVIMSVYYGATNWSGIGQYEFVGLQNFIDILTKDPVFWKGLWHAALLAALTVILQHPIAILISILLTYCGKLEKFFAAIFFIPAVISVVVTSKLWVSIFHPTYGLVNKALDVFHLSFLKHNWLGDPSTAIWCIILVVMWQGFGYALLLYHSGLQGIPESMKEAAMLDGANQFQLYTKVIIPLLFPVMRVAIVLAVVTCLKQMETIFLMTGGGPGDSTEFLGNYLYKTAFSSSLYGYGNAISVLFVVFCLILTVILNKTLKKDVGEY